MPLVCVMGEKTSSANAFPDDGLCDYIFFDSLYKNGRNMVSRKATYSNSLNTFLNEHPPYQTTSLGVGFSYHYLPMAEEELKGRNPSPLASFWQQDVYHVGILDTPTLMPENQTKAAISTLKEIDSLLETRRQLGKVLISVLAIPDPELDWSLEFAIYFSDVGFTPSMVISLGHYRFGDNTVKNCVIMPPTRHPFDLPPDDIARDYNYDLSTAVFSIRELYHKRASSRGLVSVTMKGRWTVPMSPDHVDFFSRCLSDPSSKSDFGSYTEVCADARSASGVRNKVQLTFSSKHCAMLTYNPSTKRAFVYDNEDALALKLCSAKDQDRELKFGIAAYDIDYDDYENQCGFLNKYGRHSRLKQLKMIIDYFRTQSGPPFNEEACRVFGAGDGRG
ncbi:uncharacterized protein LOC119454297 isoform X1 [Dermacentor silvarum]|uniref:uncharacterized protein LOC119454297 isoform X1 n=1 Tax=Dermacentor silvarum TaxID=543639 RepID=UPI002100FC04|nr:uncharacterized protein LOC119454297 isoform X1 [Dermacentor silvarum]